MRWILWASAGVLGTVAALGLARNGGNKFVRTTPQQDCIASYANIFGEEPDLICCTGGKDDAGVCLGGRSKIVKTLTSTWAFVIPLAGLAANAACDQLTGGVTVPRTRARRNRLLVYLAVILVRTGFLYVALNALQVLLQREESTDCWYAHLRRSERCREHFDFADHVVLAVCQYLAIQVFEMYCIVHEYYDAISSTSKDKDSRGRRSLSVVIVVGVPLAVCLFVAAYSLALVYDTAAFFHSRGETVAALLLSWFAVWSPLRRLVIGGDAAVGVGGDRGCEVASSGRLSACSEPVRGFFLAPLVAE